MTEAHTNQVNADYDYLAAVASLNYSLGLYACNQDTGNEASPLSPSIPRFSEQSGRA